MDKQTILNKISELLDQYEVPNSIGKLQFEDHNFKVDSTGWKKIVVDDDAYLENDKEDIWEFLDGECSGEQLFTQTSALRETKKAGKRMPTDEEFNEILKTKDDLPNIVYAGYRHYVGGSFANRGTYSYLWSSSSALYRALYYTESRVSRYSYSAASGFSVRCLQD
jgi:hypothetical protein